jgi:hypothetical protein
MKRCKPPVKEYFGSSDMPIINRVRGSRYHLDLFKVQVCTPDKPDKASMGKTNAREELNRWLYFIVGQRGFS